MMMMTVTCTLFRKIASDTT